MIAASVTDDITALATLIVAIATLVTALRTHGAVRTTNGTPIGQAVEQIAKTQVEDHTNGKGQTTP